MSHKTNAARILDKQNIPYELLTYKVDEQDLSAIHVAQLTGIPVEMIFKTLVLRGDKSGIFVCLIPGSEEIDLKKAARASGNKSCALTAMKELLPLTGYIRGGCSPIGMKKQYPAYIDESCYFFNEILISAGLRDYRSNCLPKI